MAEEDDIDGLAAEFVLGSLDAAERRQVDARLRTDASLAAAIVGWEQRLGPLNDRGQGLTPQAFA
jgi:anti-sigma-K factor RskA